MAVAESAITRRVVERANRGDRTRDLTFRAALLLCLLVAIVFLAALVVTTLRDGVSYLSWDFLTTFPSRLRPETSGSSPRSSGRST
jgi:phosphate transport system permease protein